MNYPGSSLGPVDYEKTLDEYWQSICPGKGGKDKTESQKEKKKQNPDKQIWRYPVKRKADELKEKASVIQRCANEIKKEADLMEADDGEVKKDLEKIKSAADQIVKIAIKITKRIDWTREANA